MQDEAGVGGMLATQAKQQAGGWVETIVNLIPGRKQAASAAPSDEAIKRTHEFLRCVHGPSACREAVALCVRSSHAMALALEAGAVN